MRPQPPPPAPARSLLADSGRFRRGSMIRPGVRGFVSHEKVAGWPIICCHCCFGGDCVSTPPGKVQVTCHVSQDHAEKDERLIVDGAVIRNGGKASVLFIENVIPILREKDIMGEKEADTPCKRIYFILQLMYLMSRPPAVPGRLLATGPGDCRRGPGHDSTDRDQ
jgi:hypothetical protein